MRVLTTASMLMALGLSVQAAGAVRFVKFDAAGANNGTSWNNAFTSLQSALAAAVAGDEVWVAAGTYRPATPSTPNPRSVTFVMKSGVKVLGGFVGSETAASQRNPRFNVCVLSGDINGDDTPNFGNRTDNSTRVVFASNVDAGCAIDGFTIRGGQADLTGMIQGAGLRVVQSTLTISNCIIRDNQAQSSGGGALFVGSDARLDQVVIAGNRASTGSALDVQGSGGSLVVSHVTIAGNHAQGGPGTTVRWLNTVGGAIGGSILWGNTNADGQDQGAQLEILNAGAFAVTNTDVQGGTAGLGFGCFSADPSFISLLGNDGIAGTGDEDFRLRPGSPCIDRVRSASLPLDALDTDGDGGTGEAIPTDLRWQQRNRDDIATSNPPQSTVDLGAYEFQGTSCAGDMDGNGVVNTIDLARFLATFGDSGEPLRPGDFNADGVVNTADLVMFLSNFGETCAV